MRIVSWLARPLRTGALQSRLLAAVGAEDSRAGDCQYLPALMVVL